MGTLKKIGLLCLLVISLLSCKSGQLLVGTTETRTDSIYIEKQVPYIVPADSAWFYAMLECDENGKVIMSAAQAEHTRRMAMQYSLDSLGRLLVKARTEPDTIKVPYYITKVKQAEVKTVPYPVPAELSWFQKLCITIGKFAIGAIALALAYFAYKVLKKFNIIR